MKVMSKWKYLQIIYINMHHVHIKLAIFTRVFKGCWKLFSKNYSVYVDLYHKWIVCFCNSNMVIHVVILGTSSQVLVEEDPRHNHWHPSSCTGWDSNWHPDWLSSSMSASLTTLPCSPSLLLERYKYHFTRQMCNSTQHNNNAIRFTNAVRRHACTDNNRTASFSLMPLILAIKAHVTPKTGRKHLIC